MKPEGTGSKWIHMLDATHIYGRNRPAGRFNLLLLSEGEYYIRDFVAECAWPEGVSGNQQGMRQIPGTLRVCTHSLFFDPDDVRVPIVRIQYIDMQSLEGKGPQRIIVMAHRWIKMKVNGMDVPYEVVKGSNKEWKFELTYSVISELMNLANRMLVISRLPVSESDEQVMLLIEDMESKMCFDVSHLRHPSSEHILFEKTVMLLFPLIRQPGRLVLTPERIYFQPLHDLTGDEAVKSHPLEGVASVVKRRSALKDIGIEIFFLDSTSNETLSSPFWGTNSAFFSFKNSEDRDLALSQIVDQQKLCSKITPAWHGSVADCLEPSSGWLPKVTSAWQLGKISNFDYILYCNLVAGRSFNDLTQYPVFPWILQDYSSPSLDLLNPNIYRDLSRPIGALNDDRLKQYVSRYQDMINEKKFSPDIDPPFMYGTHYSCPGYTLYWLVRSAPAHMLRLQNGKFDAPDRLFYSVLEAWNSVLTNPTDVKELIPEFFMPEHCGFLLNRSRLKLGTRQDGKPVHDVILPPWSNASPEEFISINRKAIESPFVSANLHHWIDLIFGIKQNGPAAVEANNVFRHLTYEGAIDLQQILDPIERVAIETAINEFGQTPRQIFTKRHPKRQFTPWIKPSKDNTLVFGSQGSIDKAVSSRSSGALSLSSQCSIGIDDQARRKPLQLIIVEIIMSAIEETNPVKDATASSELSEILEDLDVSPSLAYLDNDIGKKRCVSYSNANPEQKQGSFIEDVLIGGDNADQASCTYKGSNFGNEGRDAIPDGVSKGKEMLDSSKNAFDRVLSPDLDVIESGSNIHAKGDIKSRKRLDESSNSSFGSYIHDSSPMKTLSALAGSLSSQWQTFRSSVGRNQNFRDCIKPINCSELSVDPEFHSQDHASDSNLNETTREFVFADKESAQYRHWGSGLRGRLKITMQHSESSSANSACLHTSGEITSAFIAYEDSHLRIYDLTSSRSESFKRSYKLGHQPLTSIVAFATSGYSDTNSKGPIICCGSYDSNVHVLDTENGKIMGNFRAHDDTVSCLSLSKFSEQEDELVLVTGSWDCSMKLWLINNCRNPWSIDRPTSLCTTDLPGAPWSLGISYKEQLAVIGSEDGCLIFVDIRSPRKPIQQLSVSNDYIGGVSLLPRTCYAVSACGDGMMNVVDIRYVRETGENCLYTLNCGCPLRCCETDGRTIIAGNELGEILFFETEKILKGISQSNISKSSSLEELDNICGKLGVENSPSSCTAEHYPVNALACESYASGVHLVSAHENGLIQTYDGGII